MSLKYCEKLLKKRLKERDVAYDISKRYSKKQATVSGEKGKSLAKSRAAYEVAGRLIESNSPAEALESCNEALFYAPVPSKESLKAKKAVESNASHSESRETTRDLLSSCFTRRAKVFCTLGKYGEALADIKWAFRFGIEQNEAVAKTFDSLCHATKSGDIKSLCEAVFRQMRPLQDSASQNFADVLQSLMACQRIAVFEKGAKKERNRPDRAVYWQSERAQNVSSRSNGRYMRATDQIGPGEAILSENSHVFILYNDFLKSRCHNCFRDLTDDYILPCWNCSEVVFCSSKCAKQCWKRSHKYECQHVEFLNSFGPNTHIAFKALLESFPPNDAKHSNQNKNSEMEFSDLMDNVYSFTDIAVDYAVDNVICLMKYLKESKRCPEINSENELKIAAKFLRYFFITCVNSFGMYNLDVTIDRSNLLHAVRVKAGQHLGNSICLHASLINHSCDSNAFWYFDTNRIHLIARRLILPGEEINITYGPHIYTGLRRERINHLQPRYFFKCRCPACRLEERAIVLQCPHCPGVVRFKRGKVEDCQKCQYSVSQEDVIKCVKEFVIKRQTFTKAAGLAARTRQDFATWIAYLEKTYRELADVAYIQDDNVLEMKRELALLYARNDKFDLAIRLALENIVWARTARLAPQIALYVKVLWIRLKNQF